MKKLNNKGFTLIELLAVIVILAVVMGIATNAILNVMNDSKKKSLEGSAKSAADSFRTAYAENQLLNGSTILGISLTTLEGGNAVPLKGGTGSSAYDAGAYLNLSGTNYKLENSYVYFDSATSTFTVCLTAAETGNYYLANAIKNSGSIGPTGHSTSLPNTTMWACSDDTNSWK